MSLGLGCGSGSKAGKVFRQRMLWTMLIYMAMVLGAASIVKHGHPVGWHLYFWAVAPAAPLLGMLIYMGIYLRDETDEYLRTQAMRSLLAATGVLMATLVVNDFLRAFAHLGALPAFTAFVLFFLSFGAAQGVQQMMNRGGGDE
jgi:hypothetical protein